jgi:hypothetical protein
MAKRLANWLWPREEEIFVEYYLPDDLWTILQQLALEQEWQSSTAQPQLIRAMRLVSTHWNSTLVPRSLFMLRAVNFQVLNYVHIKPFGGELNGERIQLLAYNFPQMKEFKVLYYSFNPQSFPNLTGLHIEGPVQSSNRRALPDFRTLTSLRALSLVGGGYIFICDRLSHIASQLHELRVVRGTGTDHGIAPNDVTISQMTALRSLSVPNQTHLSPQSLTLLTDLEQLDITGIQKREFLDEGPGWGTHSQRLNKLIPLKKLTWLKMDGNFQKDWLSWTQAQVSRRLPSVQHLIVTGGNTIIHDTKTTRLKQQADDLAAMPAFPQYCRLSPL